MSDQALDLGSLDGLDFSKGEGLLPAIVQDASTGAVLMLGYMNREALHATLSRRKVVFFSRSKGRLWEKGETSSHTLELVAVRTDCDQDALLVTARRCGPVCHLGTESCFGEERGTVRQGPAFMTHLEKIVRERASQKPQDSYTASLLASGIRRIAQKVGEEGLELALAAAGGSDGQVIAEAADLFYHVLVVLEARGLALEQVGDELSRRHASRVNAGAPDTAPSDDQAGSIPLAGVPLRRGCDCIE
jgi:phosphoribosyl-AMP cyclohydrolase / phosphoribosyl-ATP pyrophosphohydrolase